jgi:hypothetical protein
MITGGIGSALAAPTSSSYTQRAGAALNTAYRPSLTRPTLVIASASVFINNSLDDGSIRVFTNSLNPPSGSGSFMPNRYQLASAAAISANCQALLSFLVAAGDYYELVSAVNAGAPTFNLAFIYELTL